MHDWFNAYKYGAMVTESEQITVLKVKLVQVNRQLSCLKNWGGF